MKADSTEKSSPFHGRMSVSVLVPGRRHDVRALGTGVAFADIEQGEDENQEAHGGTSCRGGEELLPLRNLARLSGVILHNI